jgi:type I restriction enzyme S subunit
MELTKTKFKRTEMGMIPEDWIVLPIRQIAKNEDGGIKIGPFGSALKKELLVKRGYKVYGQENVYENNLTIGDRYISKEHFYKLKSCEIVEGDFLVSMMGTVGQCMIVQNLTETGIMDSHLLRIKLNEKTVHNRYFEHTFKSIITYNQVKRLSVGGIMEGLSSKIIKQIQIPLPPTLSEQKAIATALSDVDEMIAKLEKLIEKKKAIKQGAMQQLLTPPHKGGKRLEGFEGEWVEKRLGDLVEVIHGGGTPSRAVKEFWNGNIPWATVKDFSCFNPNSTEEYISELGLKNSSTRVVETGTIILATRMAIGKVSMYNVPVSINQDLKALNFKKGVSAEFMFNWFLKNSNTLEQLGNGSTVMGISVSDLKNLKVQIPMDTIEQHAIAQTLNAMNLEISEIENKSFKIAEIKQGMMQELLTGRTRLI